MKIKTFFLSILLFSLTIMQAQEIKTTKDKKVDTETTLRTKTINATASTGDSIVFKDDSNNHLITITDEGTAGSITIPPGSAPSITSNKLYNIGSTLFFNGSSLGSGGATLINGLFDAKTDAYSVFLGSGAGTSDEGSNYNTATGIDALHSNTTGQSNAANGFEVLYSNTTGNENMANGLGALYNNTTGSDNIANGYTALYKNTTGNYNTANGISALYSNTAGGDNTANGALALFSNTIGHYNTANGFQALYNNVAGSEGVAVGYQSQYYANNQATAFINYNTSVGYQSLRGSINLASDTGSYNSALGYQSLYSNTTGFDNTANGSDALYSNTTGYGNTASGNRALLNNTGGNVNTANGYDALYSNTTGYENIADGYDALYSNTTGYDNIAIGDRALYYNTEGWDNTAIGDLAGIYTENTSLRNTTALGAGAKVTDDDQVRIGDEFVTSIGGYVDWTNISDIRYKKNIKEDVIGLDFIMGLKPITYNLDVNAIAEKLGEDIRIDKNGNKIKIQPDAEVLASRLKKSKIRQSGFSAQDVEDLAKKLGYDFGGVDKPENENGLYGLRYSEFVVPLVKAVQEQQKVIETQKEELSKLKEVVMKIQKQLNSKQLANADQ